MADSNIVRLPDLASAQPFQPTYLSSLQGQTPQPIDFLVDGCIPRGAVTLLAGAPDVGKSYIAQQLLTAAAIGQDWLGRKVEQVRTFGFFSEDPGRVLLHRQDKINRHYGIENIADLELDASWRSSDDGGAELMTFARFASVGTPTPLWNKIVPWVLDQGVQLVIIDNARRVFRGSENDANHVTSVIEMMSKLAVAMNGAVLLLMHPPKGNASYFAGSGAWEGAVRSAMSFERPKSYDEYTQEPYDERVLWVRKGNWIGRRPQIPLRFVDGVFVAEDLPQRKQSLSLQERHDLDYRMLAGLKRLLSNGTAPPADSTAPYSLPRRAKASTPEFRDYPLIWLADSVERLIATDRVVRVEVRGRVVLRTPEIILPGEKEWRVI